jgi:hypothetical protein
MCDDGIKRGMSVLALFPCLFFRRELLSGGATVVALLPVVLVVDVVCVDSLCVSCFWFWSSLTILEFRFKYMSTGMTYVLCK